MHFSIPEASQSINEKGSSFWNYHIHVNGVYHCKQRYSLLDKFYEQVNRDFPGRIPPGLFPGKKILSLNLEQIELRREQLERFIQHISQDAVIGTSSQFNDFFLKAQREDQHIEAKQVDLDVYLLNGNKVTVQICNTMKTDDVLQATMTKIGLDEMYINYFALFMMHKEEDTGVIKVVRKLQEFESPYLSLHNTKDDRIVIRRNYWSSKYDEEFIGDRIAMNLLYVQVVDDLDRGWMLPTEAQRKKLNKLLEQGSRNDFLKFARGLKFYGFTHFSPCTADYPSPETTVLMSVGGREFNIRVKAEEEKIMEGTFKIQRIRSWRLSSVKSEDEGEKSEKLQFAFEYLFSKNDIRWITVESTQAVMMSMAMQGIVEEILREQQGKGIPPFSRRASNCSTKETKSEGTLSQKRSIKRNEVFATQDIGDDDL